MTDAMMHDLGPEAQGSAALRVAVVAPCEGRRGAGTVHSTRVARQLADAGHEVTLLLWSHQQSPAADARERGAPVRIISALQRARPGSWVQSGRRLRGFDSIVVVHSGPFEIAAHLCLLRAAGALPGRAGVLRSRPRSIVVDLAPRSLPSPARPVPTGVAGPLLMACDSVLVHDDAQAVLARRLGARRVSLVGLPATSTELVDATDAADAASPAHPAMHEAGPHPVRLLLLHPVHDRPETERLLRAVRSVPGITLTIAAEAVGSDRHLTSAIAADPALAARVVVREGRVREQTLARLLAEHDVLVVPPTAPLDSDGGDAAQSHLGAHVALAHAHGLAALAPDVAPFSKQVIDGVDGLLVARGSETALADALRRLREPLLRDRLRLGRQHRDLDTQWAHYLGALEALSVDTGSVPEEAVPVATADSSSTLASLRRSMHGRAPRFERTRRVATGLTSTVTTRATRRGVVDLTASLDAVSATDVLDAADELDAVPDALRQARSLGLPRARDQVCAWAALGALAAIVRVCDDGGREAVIVDESGPRSVFSRWAKAAGLAPVPLGFTGIRPRAPVLEADAGSLDAVVRVHPQGCDATDVDQVLEQASWALRPRGLLIVTVPIGPPGVDGAFAPADVRGIVARALDLGFVLVGDLDGALTARMRQAAIRARADDVAYGLVRLTLRRR